MAGFENFLLNYPIPGTLIFIGAAVLVAFACYGLTRKLLRPHAGVDSIQMSTSIIARLGALHALILALIFAQEMADYRDISRITSKEASSIIDVYTNLLIYDGDEEQSTGAIIEQVVEFVKTISTKDRVALARQELSQQTRLIYLHIDRDLRNLKPDGKDQENLKSQMLSDWEKVSEFHLRLRTIVEYETPTFFWLVIISGFIAVVIPSYTYMPNPGNLALLATFAAFNGIVMYVIFSITNPFSGALAIDSRIMEHVLELMYSAPE